MGESFLRRISRKYLKLWKRADLEEKMVEIARNLLVSREKNIQLKKKNAELEDEVRRLRGEKARPKFKGKEKVKKRDTSELDHSDDDDPPAPKKKAIPVDREVEVDVDQEDLPKDARFIGTTERVVQNLVLRRENVKFIFKRYYSPSEGKTYIGEIEGMDGSKFGGDLKAFIDYLYFKLRVPHEKIREFLSEFEIAISKGQLCRILNAERSAFEEELQGARDASLKRTKCNHLDETGHKLNNSPLYTFCFSNVYMTFLKTFARKTKADAMSATFGTNEKYCFNHDAIKKLDKLTKNNKLKRKARSLFSETVFSRESFFKILKNFDFTPPEATWIKTAAFYGAYLKGVLGPPIKYLVTDDAKNLNFWPRHQLCWVHEIRKYKLLDIYGRSSILDELLEEMRLYYRSLREFRRSPDEEKKKRLEKRFNEIFGQKSPLHSITAQLLSTMKNKKKLLYVLDHPEVEIHNNQVERDIREKVIKRKISLFNQSLAGVKSWDLMLSLASTCKKNGVSFYQFLLDRHNCQEKVPFLGQIIVAS